MDLADIIIYVTLGVIFYLVATTIRSIIWPPKPIVFEYQPAMVGNITADELQKYDGRDPYRPILFAVRGKIYDVTEGRNFYGPGNALLQTPALSLEHFADVLGSALANAGGPYQLFAGKEVARALGRMQIQESECNANTSDFTEKENKTLQDWQEKFESKYKIVGEVVPAKQLTLPQLAGYDGKDPTNPIYLSVRGTIYDVSAGRDFYGPDGAYPFAGKECARALAKFSTEIIDCNDDLEECTLAEMDALRDWEARFYSKYPIVGKLVKE